MMNDVHLTIFIKLIFLVIKNIITIFFTYELI